MTGPWRRQRWAALLLGGTVAAVLVWWRPDAWHWGSTPRFILTIILAVAAWVVMTLRRGR
jgi:hypothetical protein